MAVDDWFGLRSYRPFSITIAAPGVITSDAHGLELNDKVTLTTTGALPTGLSVDTYYFVIKGTYSDGTNDPDTFKVSATKDGSAITTTGSQSGAHFYATPRRGMTPSNESNK
jgi:hypothetical protein